MDDLTPAYARRIHELLEPLCTVAFFAREPNDALTALGLRDNYWDGYFAARAGSLGPVDPEVVDAAFYSFAPGEVARHIPQVWTMTTPAAALEARLTGCAAALRRTLGSELGASPELARAADLATDAVRGASITGRVLFASLRAQPVPDDPVERLWHAANCLREHRGDGHVAALLTHGIGRSEAHVLLAIDLGMAASDFGRLHHLPAEYVAGVVEGLRERGLVASESAFTESGRQLKAEIELLTDRLALDAYRCLTGAQRAELGELLAPLSAAFEG